MPLVLSVLAAALKAAPSSGACADHAIDGYYAGMSREEAAGLRAVETATTDRLLIRETDRTTTIDFDAEGNLSRLEQKRDHVDADDLNRELFKTFGPPAKETREAVDATKGTSRVIMSLWKDRACGQRVVIVYTYKRDQTRAVIRLDAE